MPLKSALDLAQKHPDQFLSEQVFRNLYIDEFKFGPGTSGNLGLNMVSQHIVAANIRRVGGRSQPVPKDKLALHLNCVVKASTLQNNTISIHVLLFHLTARSLATQKKIDAHGPSVITADNSIHTNVNTGWGRAENLRALAQEVGLNGDQVLVGHGYNNAFMRYLVKEFRVKVEQRIHQYLGGNVVVKWKGDKTFPTA